MRDLSQENLRRDPSCIECRHDAAEAQFSLALADRTSEIRDVESRLAEAVKELEDVSARRTSYSQDAARAAETLHRFEDDELPVTWESVTRISDPDERLAALLEHHTVFGSKCRHPVSDGWQAYIAHYRSLTAAAQFQRLMRFQGTPIAKALLDSYISGRLSSVAKASDRLALLRQVRINVSDTDYVAWADARYREELSSFFEREWDPEVVDEVCRQLDSNENVECQRLSRSLWQKRLDLLDDPRAKYEVCKELKPEELKKDCKAEAALAAITGLKRYDLVESAQLARWLCAQWGDPNCDRKLQKKTYQWAADDAFDHLNTFGLDGVPDQASHSVGAWQAYIALFDRIARDTIGKGDSLKSLYPEGYSRAVAQRNEAKRLAKRRLNAKKPFCDAAVRDRRSSSIEQCIAVIGAIAQQDQSNISATDLLDQLYSARADLSGARAGGLWQDVGTTIFFSEFARVIFPERYARTVVRVLNAMLGH